MIKVLHVLSAVNGGGVEAMLLNYYKHIDRSQVSFDFVAHKENGNLLAPDFENLGGKIYYITSQRKSIRKNQKELKEILLKTKYDVIHFHHGVLSLGVGVAKKYSPESKIVVHSHSIYEEDLIARIFNCCLKRYVLKKSDYYCACGVMAAEHLFGKTAVRSENVYIINNAIETQKFVYNKQFRQSIRFDYRIENNEFVIGVVGRLTPVKNPFFILEIANELKKRAIKYKILWVGDGELKAEIEKKIKELKLDNFVVLAGLKKNVNEFYSAFDVFILPSNFEGLPVVAIEAQQNGCPVLLADTITNEVVISDNCKRLPLNAECWCNEIEKYCIGSKRIDNSAKIKERGFDINTEAEKLTNFYKKITQ